MRAAIALMLMLATACAATTPQQATTPTPQAEPTYESRELPERPDATPVPEDQRWVEGADQCRTRSGAVRTGILMSDAQAARVARWVAAYDELRGLYQVDQQTWELERDVYRRRLDLADREIADLRERTRRSWWERHGPTVGLVGGLVLGITSVVGGGIAIERAGR